MAKSSPSKKQSKKQSEQQEEAAQQQAAEQKAAKAAAKAKAKATAKLAALTLDAKKARKTAQKAAKAAEKAQAKAVAAGAPTPKAKPDEASLLKLALRGAEAKLTDAERRAEALERQIAALHARDELEEQQALEDAIVDAAVAATVVDAVLDAEVVADVVDEAVVVEAVVVEAVAVELDEIADETQQEAAEVDPEPSHEGEAAEAAQVFAQSDAGAEPTVTTSELTPPTPAKPADDRPSEAWTLLRLRTEAKRRGLTGTSNLPKGALLDRLRSA